MASAAAPSVLSDSQADAHWITSSITISPPDMIFDPETDDKTPRKLKVNQSKVNQVVVACNTLDAVLQLYCSGRLGKLRHIGGE